MEGAAFVDRGLLVSAETRELWLFTNGTFQCRSPATLTTPLIDRTALGGTDVELNPGAVGCPVPMFQWRFNGVVIPGATNATLTLTNVTASAGGWYEVTASNRFGFASSSGVLTIRIKPDVRISEVMPGAAVSPGVPTSDWWELTNFDPRPVDLTGWRFNDGTGGLADPYVFASGPILNPGETMIFVEGLTAAEFRSWWGTQNLPPTLKIFSYTGSGLSFRLTGDTLFLWDATSTDPADTVDSASFGSAQLGVTFNYDPATGIFGERSVLGVNGVFQAASAPDIGSPGIIAAAVTAPQLSIQTGPAPGLVRIGFEARAGFVYTLERSPDLHSGSWVPTGDVFSAPSNQAHFFDATNAGSAQFFRVQVTR
jgi:hypothetical protein